MLPSIDTPRDEGQIQEIVKEIGTAVFKSAKLSMESAAKAVVPSMPDMVNEILDDLKSGSVRTFNLALDKLDRLVQKLGIDLKDYSKELANFQTKREEKLIKSEEKIQILKEKNIIAEIEKSGDITILSNRDIENRKDNLYLLEKQITKMEKALEQDRKSLQENNKLKGKTQSLKKEEIVEKAVELNQKKQKRDSEKDLLGQRGEQQPGIFQRGREATGNFVDEYVPTPIAEIGQMFVQGLTAPLDAMKDLATTFGGLLKPLKLLKPLFKGLLGSLKKFALGLKASLVAMLPMIAIAALVGIALFGLYKVFKWFAGKYGKAGPGESGLGGSQDTDLPMEEEYAIPGQYGETESKKMRTSIVDPKSKQIIQPDDPRYDEVYKSVTGKEAPKQNEYFIEGKKKILPMTEDGQIIKSGNFQDNKYKMKATDKLVPEKKSESKKSTSIINAPRSSTITNNSTIGGGLFSARNDDWYFRSYKTA